MNIKNSHLIIALVLSLPINNADAKKIVRFEYSPSPRSIDFHEQFNKEYNAKWKQLRTRTDYFRFPSTVLHSKNPLGIAFPHNAALNSSELDKAAEMLNNHNFNIAIDASMSLGAGDVCDPNKDIIEAAKNAAKYEIEVLENLAHHNINVNRIYLDGPLLRLLKYTKKDHSCNRTAAGGRNVVQSVAILDHYMKTIKQRFPAVDFFIIVNLINWKQGPYSPYYGTLAYDFNKVFRVFLRQYKAQSEYKLAGIQIDTPWHTIRNRPNEYLERLNMINRVMQIELGSTESKSMTLSIVTNSAPNNNYEKAGFFAYKAIPQNKYSRTIPYSEWCARPVNFELGNNCYTNDLKMYNDQWNFMRFVLDSYNSDTRLMNFEKLEIAINSWYASPRNIVSAMVENSESYNYIERTYKQMSDYRAMENKTNP